MLKGEITHSRPKRLGQNRSRRDLGAARRPKKAAKNITEGDYMSEQELNELIALMDAKYDDSQEETTEDF